MLGVLWVILSISLSPNMVSRVEAKKLNFGFTLLLRFLSSLLWLFRCFLPSSTQISVCYSVVCFSSGVPGGLGPTYPWNHQLLLSSFGLIQPLSSSQDLAYGIQPGIIGGRLIFLPFLNYNSCHLLTSFLSFGLVAHFSLVQVYNLVPDVLWQLFCLVCDGGEVGIEETDYVDRCASTSHPCPT